MKILIVAMPHSIHTARWVHQLADQGWDVHVFPSTDEQYVSPALESVTLHQYLYIKQPDRLASVKMKGVWVPNPLGLGVYFTEFVKRLIRSHNPYFHARRLRKLISRLQPDVIHSVEFQHAGYLTLDSLYLPMKSKPRGIRSLFAPAIAGVIGEERLWRLLVGNRNLMRRIQGKPALQVEYVPSPAELDRRKRRALRRSPRQVAVDTASSIVGEERLWRFTVSSRNFVRRALGRAALEIEYIPRDAGTDAHIEAIIDTMEDEETAVAPPTIGVQDYADERLVRTDARWVVTSWGSDIYLFGRIAEHEGPIRALLTRAEYFSCGCEREVALAKAFGFAGEVLPVFASTGGFRPRDVEDLRQSKPSERKVIVLKGYQHFAGRALVGLRALERCADVLVGYEVAIPMAIGDVLLAAQLFEHETGVPVRVVPHSEHREMLRLLGSARISIGLSISDGLPGFLLEGMAMGSFPIQSWTSCADEWVEDGVNAFLVPPEDPEIVEKAIRAALADDDLVDRAATLNWEIAKSRLDYSQIKNRTVQFYERVMAMDSHGSGME